MRTVVENQPPSLSYRSQQRVHIPRTTGEQRLDLLPEKIEER